MPHDVWHGELYRKERLWGDFAPGRFAWMLKLQQAAELKILTDVALAASDTRDSASCGSTDMPKAKKPNSMKDDAVAMVGILFS